MLRKPRTVPKRVHELEDDILAVRAEQRDHQQKLGVAIADEVRGMELIDSARAMQGRCRLKITECAEAIGSLQDEIRALLPVQRSQ